jgi:hypothetical protein
MTPDGVCKYYSVSVTRDPVCMADDAESPHETRIEMPAFVDPEEVVMMTYGIIPNVNGYKHSWTCKLNNLPIAEISSSMEINSLVNQTSWLDENHIHFAYHSSQF